eukprot:INCI16023.1.p1 GENE.INCI16023.1~~INCI16023.1.p1  ORF type:complete len:551 (-),score=78.32 INCI16023.1:1443-3095(-)
MLPSTAAMQADAASPGWPNGTVNLGEQPAANMTASSWLAPLSTRAERLAAVATTGGWSAATVTTAGWLPPNGTANCSSTATWFGDQQALELAYVAIGCAMLSFVGALFIVVTYFALPELWRRKNVYGMRLVMYLSLTNALEAVGTVVGNSVQVLLIWAGNPCGFDFWNCQFVAWFVEFLGLASLLWASNIGFFFFLTFVRPIPGATVRKRTEIAFNVVAWGVPLAFTAVGVALDIYGPAGDVCWISGDNYLHQFFLDGLIAVLSIAWNLFVIVRSVCIIKRQKARMTAENGIVLRMMYWYILVFIAGHLFGFGNRIWEYYISNINSSKDHSFILVLLQNIFATVQGFGFAVMYGANKTVWQAYRLRCCGQAKGSPGAPTSGCFSCCGRGRVWSRNRATSSTSSVSSFDLDINTNSDGGDDDDSMVGYVGVSESGAFLPSADGYSVMSVGSYESDTSGFSGGGHEDGTVGTSSQPTRLVSGEFNALIRSSPNARDFHDGASHHHHSHHHHSRAHHGQRRPAAVTFSAGAEAIVVRHGHDVQLLDPVREEED